MSSVAPDPDAALDEFFGIGDFRTDAEVAALRAVDASEFGLDPENLLVSRYGFPTLPVPPAGNQDGTGKLPRGLPVRHAGHPVFWLDRATRLRQADEDDEHYAIRLYLELVERGWMHPVSLETADVLKSIGMDPVANPADGDLVSRYIEGDDIPRLSRLFLTPVPEDEAHPAGWAQRQAASIAADAAVMYEEFLTDERALAAEERSSAVAEMQEYIDGDIPAGLRTALLALDTASASGDNDQFLTGRGAVRREVMALTERLAEAERLALRLYAASPRFDADAATGRAEANIAGRAAEAERLLGALYSAGASFKRPANALYAYLDGESAKIRQWGQQAIDIAASAGLGG